MYIEIKQAFAPQPAGRYPARILQLSETSSDYGEGLRWEFEIESEDGVQSIWGFTSVKSGRGSKMVRWLRQLGIDVTPGTRVDLSHLRGMPVEIELTIYLNDDGEERNRVVDVRRPAGMLPAEVSVASPDQSAAPPDDPWADWFEKGGANTSSSAGAPPPTATAGLPTKPESR